MSFRVVPCAQLLKQKKVVDLLPPEVRSIPKHITKKITKPKVKLFASRLSRQSKIYRGLAAKSPGMKRAVFPILAALVVVGRVLKEASKAKARVIGKAKSISKEATKDKQDVVQKQEDVVITIPDERLDTKSKTSQLQKITQILIVLGGAAAFRVGGKTVSKKQTRLRGGLAKARKYIFNRLQKRRRSFTPDIYSLIFGIRATRGQKIKLLRKGRVFTGLERRAIVK